MDELRIADPEGFLAAESLLHERPELRLHSRIERDGDALPYLLVQIPAPVRSHGDLWISTEDGEWTVAFDEWHRHLNFEELTEVLRLIDEILNEDIVVAVKTQDGVWTGSTAYRVGMAASPEFASYPGVAYVRSWRGTFDVS
jgi:hypothetical protein